MYELSADRRMLKPNENVGQASFPLGTVNSGVGFYDFFPLEVQQH